MIPLSRPRRPARPNEWTRGKVVAFIVTLAATRSVTFAAREAGMSRKSAYALRSRDSAFAAAWTQALNARPQKRQDYKVEKADTCPSPVAHSQGDKANRAAPSNSSTGGARLERRLADEARDRFFATLAANHRRRPGQRLSPP